MIHQCVPELDVYDYYSAKIMTYLKAYGTGYDFCRFYGGDGFTAMLFNSSLTVCGDPHDREEFAAFADMTAPYTIESGIAALDGYTASAVTYFEGTVAGDTKDTHMIGSVYEMSACVSRCLGADRDMWYTDMSHRIRHGCSEAYRCGESYAAADMRYGERIYISSVVSPENERGCGNIRGIFSFLSREGICCVRAEPALCGFYAHIGLDAVSEHTMLVRQI